MSAGNKVGLDKKIGNFERLNHNRWYCDSVNGGETDMYGTCIFLEKGRLCQLFAQDSS